MPPKTSPPHRKKNHFPVPGRARIVIYNPNTKQIIKRVEFSANCKDPLSDPFQALSFISANFISQKGIKQRQNWPIGNIIDQNGKILN